MRAERIVNTLDSSLHFIPIALSLNISRLIVRQLFIRGDFIVRVPQPWHSSTDHYERARASNISLGICNEWFASNDE
jgi:fructose-1,6-bisphosphatase